MRTRATPWMRARWIAERDVADVQVRVEHAAALHFVPVVVFGIDPEDRAAGTPCRRRPVGQPDGRDRLEQGEQRTAEERRLLTGHHRDGPRIAKLGGCGDRFGWRAAGAAAPDLSDRLAMSRISLRPRERIHPCRRIGGVAGKELCDARVVERVVRRERRSTGTDECRWGVARWRCRPRASPRARMPRQTRQTVGSPPGTVAELRA